MRVVVRVASAAGLSLLAGCTSTTPTGDKTAAAALAQLVAYETEVVQKIRVENNYYATVMDAADDSITRFWEDQQSFKFDQEAKAFAVQNTGIDKEQVGPKLVAFMDASIKSWATRDQGYDNLRSNTQRTLRENRQQLELELGQIRSLRGTLQNLSEARSTKEMLLLAIAFAENVKTKYDELRGPPPKTSDANTDQ